MLCRTEGYGLVRRHREPLTIELTAAGKRLATVEPPAAVTTTAAAGDAALVFDAELLNVRGVRARLAVLERQPLTALDDAIQQAFGWYDDHLYSFWLDGSFFGSDEFELSTPDAPDSASLRPTSRWPSPTFSSASGSATCSTSATTGASAREPADHQHPHRRHDAARRHDPFQRPPERQLDRDDLGADRVEVRGEPGKQAGVFLELEPERPSQPQVRIDMLSERGHRIAPGHSEAASRSAWRSTLA